MATGKLTGYGKPSVLLPGVKGQIYVDKLTGNEYECKGERGFVRVDGDDQDNQFNWVLKKQEKPFYQEELITIDLIPGFISLVRVSSEVLTDFASHIPQDIPEGMTPEEVKAELDETKPLKVWIDGSLFDNVYSEGINGGIGLWGKGEVIIACAYRDNATYGEMYLPKIGTYVSTGGGHYISGIGYIDDESPRIAWDGKTTKLKKLDQKFIPSRIIGVINRELTFTADPSFDPTTMSVYDALSSGMDLLYTPSSDTIVKCVSWDKRNKIIGFHNTLAGMVYQFGCKLLSDGTVSIESNNPR